MSLIMWLREPGRRGQLLWQLYGEDSEAALKALGELRQQGWLEDASLRGVDLHEVNLPGGDLREVDLEEANLSYANLEKADLTLAELAEAELVETNLEGANLTETNFYYADLRGADLTGANMEGTLLDMAVLKFATVTEEQLRQADALAGAVMPDGSSYDGRFRLEGDLFEASERGIDLDDPERMAEFYAIPLAFYQRGQEWAKENLMLSEPSKSQEYGELEKETDEVVEAKTYSLLNPLDYINLFLDIFQNPKQILEYRQNPAMRHNLRVMGAWLAATLIWLPSIVQGLILFPQSVPQYEARFSPWILNLTFFFVSVLFIAAWVLPAIACQRRRDEEKVTMILAVAIACIYSIGLNLETGLASLFAYLIGLIVAQHILSRRARITLAWIAMFHFAGLWNFQFNETILPSLRTSGLLETTMSAWVFSLTRYIWGTIALLIVQYVVKSSVLRELGKHQRPVGGALLIIGYLGAFALVIWKAIVAIQ